MATYFWSNLIPGVASSLKPIPVQPDAVALIRSFVRQNSCLEFFQENWRLLHVDLTLAVLGVHPLSVLALQSYLCSELRHIHLCAISILILGILAIITITLCDSYLISLFLNTVQPPTSDTCHIHITFTSHDSHARPTIDHWVVTRSCWCNDEWCCSNFKVETWPALLQPASCCFCCVVWVRLEIEKTIYFLLNGKIIGFSKAQLGCEK